LNRKLLSDHELDATGTTGRLLEDELQLPVGRFLSGPLGGLNRLGRTSPTARSSFSSSFGIHWSRIRTIRM